MKWPIDRWIVGARWFAWRPVRLVITGQWIWLEWVWRCFPADRQKWEYYEFARPHPDPVVYPAEPDRPVREAEREAARQVFGG